MNITVSGAPGPIEKSEIDVWIESRKSPTVKQPINIVEVRNDGTYQYLVVKFGGQDSGIWDLKVRSRSYGSYDTTGITLTLVGKVTDFNPK